MQTAEIESEIRDYIITNFLFGRKEALRDDTALFGGIIDSTGAIELVMFLQNHFNITVEDDEVGVPESFGSLKQVVAFVERKLGRKA
ncbi:MAG: acyl carrier protein [Candidatus Sulfotelmatobacter sp.]